jgi:hypothetical protein
LKFNHTKALRSYAVPKCFQIESEFTGLFRAEVNLSTMIAI